LLGNLIHVLGLVPINAAACLTVIW
jgi:hypothetical protein